MTTKKIKQLQENSELIDERRTSSKQQRDYESSLARPHRKGRRRKGPRKEDLPDISRIASPARVRKVKQAGKINSLFSLKKAGRSPFLAPRRNRITNGLDALNSLGFSIGPVQKRTNMLAHDALHGFGLTVAESYRTQLDEFDHKDTKFNRDFSLVATQTTEVRFRNAQLVTDDTYMSTPQLVTPKGFTDQTDPFYQLDDARPHQNQLVSNVEKQLNMPDMIPCASAITVFHIANSHSKYLNLKTKSVWKKEIV